MQLADPFYYLRNFHTLLETLETRDGDLLDDEQRRFLDDFRRLPPPPQALLVRMCMREGNLFRGSRLRYAEIGDLAVALPALAERGWIDEQPALTLDDLFRLFSKRELGVFFALSNGRLQAPKARLREDMRADHGDPRTLDQWSPSSTDRVYRLQVDAVCERLQRLFFGNFHQSLTDFVLADLGVFRYEKIDLPGEWRPFRTRGQVEHFYRLHDCRRMLHEDAHPSEVLPLLPPPIEGSEWLNDRREKLRFQLARELERRGERVEALAIYRDCAYPDASRRADRLGATLVGAKRVRQPRPPGAPEFTLGLERPPGDPSVERCVLDHLATRCDEPTSVHYVENGLFTSLFGLLFWPAVFAPVAGAFFHAFHQAPADLTSHAFADRRREVLDGCFEELRTGSYGDTMRRRFIEKAGIASPFVAWGLLDAGLLDTALACIPAAHLLRLFEWILADIRAHRSGFPDLVQFWPRSGRYRLIEVKGPGDRLQDSQRRCLAHCLRHDIPVSVCHVAWNRPSAIRQSGCARTPSPD